jgi:hypothetical protein
MAQVHFSIRSKPVVKGQDVEACCQHIVKHAEVVPLEGDAFIVALGRTSCFCPECFKAVVTRQRTRRRKYIYALVTGEERFHQEAA